MNIQLVNLNAQHTPIRADLDRAVREVFDANAFVLGRFVQTFEEEAARYLGVKHAVSCASGSDALYLALRALGVGPGDEVVTVPHTFIATPEYIRRTGAKPVFCDVEPQGWMLDPRKLAACVTPRTKAIMPVHIYGQCCDMEAIAKAAPGIPIVEDACQAWGASRNGRKAGALGTIGCFSFYPTKTLGACGDGGMMSTNDDGLAALMRKLRVYGEGERRYFSSMNGVNSRLDGIQAAILSVKLRHVDKWNAGRAEIAAYYAQRFKGSRVKLAQTLPGNTHVWHQCIIDMDQRDTIMDALKARGVMTGVYYPVPQHLQGCFADLGYYKGSFPVTEAICARNLSLPSWPEMSEAERRHVADSVLAVAGG